MDTNGHESENNAFPLKFWVLEIQNYSNAKFGYFQVVQHLSSLQVSDPVDDLGVHHHGIEGDDIGDEHSDLLSFVRNVIGWLLQEGDSPQPKFDNERVFIRFLMKPVADLVHHFHCGTNDPENLLF